MQIAPITDAEPIWLTAGIIAVTLAVLTVLYFLRQYLHARRGSRLVDVIIGLVAVASVVLGGAAFVTLWEAESLVDQLATSLSNPVATGSRGLLTILILAGVYVGMDFLYDALQRFLESREEISQHQAEVSFRVAQVSVYTAVLFVILGIWKVNVSGLLVGAGFLGIVFGLAAQQTLGALIAGFILMFSRPFEIGDWVEIGDREGIVTDITIVNTRVQTFDGEYVMLPNDMVSGSPIVNRTRKGRLRIRVDVGVDYGTDLERAREIARNSLSDITEILQVPQPQVVIRTFADSAIVLQVRFWIDKPTSRRRWRARTAAIRAIKAAFDEEQITIPFPQRTLSDRQPPEPTSDDQVVPEAGIDPAPDGGE